MAQFGLFYGSDDKPRQVFEAETMIYSGGDIVTFVVSRAGRGDALVGIVKLDVNQCIRQINPLEGTTTLR
jgi:hypothetical protein